MSSIHKHGVIIVTTIGGQLTLRKWGILPKSKCFSTPNLSSWCCHIIKVIHFSTVIYYSKWQVNRRCKPHSEVSFDFFEMLCYSAYDSSTSLRIRYDHSSQVATCLWNTHLLKSSQSPFDWGRKWAWLLSRIEKNTSARPNLLEVAIFNIDLFSTLMILHVDHVENEMGHSKRFTDKSDLRGCTNQTLIKY